MVSRGARIHEGEQLGMLEQGLRAVRRRHPLAGDGLRLDAILRLATVEPDSRA